MIKIETNKGRIKINIEGCRADVLTDIMSLLEEFNDDEIEAIKKALTEIADE